MTGNNVLIRDIFFEEVEESTLACRGYCAFYIAGRFCRFSQLRCLASTERAYFVRSSNGGFIPWRLALAPTSEAYCRKTARRDLPAASPAVRTRSMTMWKSSDQGRFTPAVSRAASCLVLFLGACASSKAHLTPESNTSANIFSMVHRSGMNIAVTGLGHCESVSFAMRALCHTADVRARSELSPRRRALSRINSKLCAASRHGALDAAFDLFQGAASDPASTAARRSSGFARN